MVGQFFEICDSYVMLKNVNLVRDLWNDLAKRLRYGTQLSRNLFDMNGFVGETNSFVVTHMAAPLQIIHMYIYRCIYIYINM